MGLQPLSNSHLSVTVLLIFGKIAPIYAVLDIILCDPLPIILTSHRGNLDDSHATAKVHLIPLVACVIQRTPGPQPRT